jgi:hypothetical protein
LVRWHYVGGRDTQMEEGALCVHHKEQPSLLSNAVSSCCARRKIWEPPCWSHLVVFQAAIASVKVFALACAWSQRGVSCFLSTCGKTTPHETKHMSHYEDDFGNVVHNEINRPAICHFLCEHLPLIDEHNEQRQNLLNLERCWCTKDPWMRLLTTTLGMCVVDMHRWHRNRKYDDGEQQESRGQSVGNELLAGRKFSDRLCVGLERKGMWIDRASARQGGRNSMIRIGDHEPHDDPLERITM